ncbi:ankyrin repeat family protein [Anaeramoeba flamelloides]|uniref:Ankyrin repeat family protein n=1 Tax=Anaeramoeba flamelloides TaxID=1746091 RepID=A0AAV7ZCX6_9EUKA|nr:ankyrin repeat family protein [Anaeramoeba flamelloides]
MNSFQVQNASSTNNFNNSNFFNCSEKFEILPRETDVSQNKSKTPTNLYLSKINEKSTCLSSLVDRKKKKPIKKFRTLKEAIEKNSFLDVENQMGNGFQPNVVDRKGHSCLYYACSQGNLEMIKYFLGYESSKTINNKQNYESFLKGIKKGHSGVVDLFHEKGLSPYQKTRNGETALHIGCLFGSVGVVKKLLEHNYSIVSVDKNKNTPLMSACKKGKAEIVELLLSQKEDCKVNASNLQGETALILGSKYGHASVVHLLIKHGSKLMSKTKSNSNSLYEASKNGHVKVVGELLKNGAYVDSVVDGWTSLLIACQNGSLEIAQRLLQYGSNVTYSEPEYGFTALFVAIENGHFEIVQELLNFSQSETNSETNVLLDQVSLSEETPLHLAATNGNLEIIKLLIDSGSNLESKDDCDLTPLMCAVENDDEEAVLLLLNNGAKITENDSFQIEYLENLKIKKLLQNYHQICLDFLDLFNSQENCDYLITNNYSQKIGIHSSLVECRLEDSTDNLITEFKCHQKSDLELYFKWVYSGLMDNDNERQLHIIDKINSNLNINTKQKSGKFAIQNDYEKLFHINSSKNFILTTSNENIPVHKFILQARSKMFQGLFLSVPNLSQINDHSKTSLQSIKCFIKYLYTDKFDNDLNNNQLHELENAQEYFQLSQKSLLDYLLDSKF